MYSQPSMQLTLKLLVFFVTFFVVPQVNALAIISLLEDSVTAKTTVWSEGRPDLSPWTTSYNGPGYPDDGSNSYRNLTNVIGSAPVFDDNSGTYGFGGNFASADVDSRPAGITLTNRVSSISDPGLFEVFGGLARSETQLDWLFRVDGADVDISIFGEEVFEGGSVGYSLYDVTADSLLGSGGGGRFSLSQNSVYRMLLQLVAESAGDPPETLVDVNFRAPGTSVRIVHAVPEPASFALMGLGLVGLGFVRNRKRNNGAIRVS